VKPSRRETRRLQTRERIMGAAIAEFTRSGMADADVNAIVTAAGVARGTFYFHFPTKEHVLLELERREEARSAAEFARFLSHPHDLTAAFNKIVELITALERRFGRPLFRELLALHFLPSRLESEDWTDHPLIVLLVQEVEGALGNDEAHPEVDAFYGATFFLLGIYGVLSTTGDAETRDTILGKLVASASRGLEAR
jgi:TetR/AcrR family transcriptional regulator, repressor for uid operon